MVFVVVVLVEELQVVDVDFVYDLVMLMKVDDY